MKKGFPHLLLLPVLSLSCGGEAPESPADEPAAPVCDVVRIDSIGMEMGDSDYVFGAIIDAACLDDGRIALVDVLRKEILVYSGDGVFQARVGGEGSGPGMFAAPFSIAPLSHGGFAVSDVQLGKVVLYDSTLQLLREITGFQPMAPTRIRTGPDGGFIGSRSNWHLDEETDEVYSGIEYCLWTDTDDPERIYRQDYALHSSGDRVWGSFASSPTGEFFWMPRSKEEYAIVGYDAEGRQMFTVEAPWEVTPVTQEELDVARPFLVIPGPGSDATSTDLMSDWSPETQRDAGSLIGIDGRNRLWVRSGRGSSAAPVFELYDAESGALLMTVETTLPPIARYWTWKVYATGILGWDHNPSDYTRVYSLELVER